MCQGLVDCGTDAQKKKLKTARQQRYSGWDEGMGKDILDSKLSMEDISGLVLAQDINPQPRSGRQEHLENLVNRYI
jgi:xylose isomerase